MTPSSRVVFFQVNDNAAKLKILVDTAHLHFAKKEPILFFVEDEKGEKFLDELFWKSPPVSFLPHLVSDGPTKDLVVITKSKHNVNEAHVAFNLCPMALSLPFKLLYEFEDLTTPVKKNFSSQRFDVYKRSGFFIEAR